MKNLSKLFEKTSKILESGLPLSSAINLLHDYKGNDWGNFSNPYTLKKYFTNTVTENDYLSMAIITWESSHSTRFHIQKRDSIFKIIDGQIKESYSDESLSVTHTLDTNQVFYRPKNFGFHKLFCPERTIGCVSLHLYDKRM